MGPGRPGALFTEDVLVGDGVRPYLDDSNPAAKTSEKEESATTENQEPKIEKLERGERERWDLSKKPETRLEIVKYHRELMRKKGYDHPDIYN